MHSRSTSGATRTEIERRESISSVHRRRLSFSSSSIVDPVVARQHALVAATLAYERAYDNETLDQDEDLVFARPGAKIEQHGTRVDRQRSRRSRASGFEGEGSHFSRGTRTPARRISKRLSNASDAQGHHARSRCGTLSRVVAEDDFAPTSSGFAPHKHGISRVPSADTVRNEEYFKKLRSSISVHKLRKVKSMYSSSSPVRSTSIDDISFAPPSYGAPVTSPVHQNLGTTGELEREIGLTSAMANVPTALTQTNLESLAAALPRIRPRDVNSQSLRNRASVILTPFTKRRDKTPTPHTSPPPLPSSASPIASIVRSPGHITRVGLMMERRQTSGEVKKLGSVKARLRNVFRRSSGNTQDQELPVQQVNARRSYYGNPALPNAQSYTVSRASLKPPPVALRGSSPSHSDLTISSRSRVTSWADSTIAGTVAGDNDTVVLGMIEEESLPALQPAIQPARKHSSLNLFRRMRRSSRGDMLSSDSIQPDSELDVLQQTVRKMSEASHNESRRTSVGRSTLPSQIRKVTTIMQSSIRAVSNQNIRDDELARNDEMGHLTEHDLGSADRSSNSTLQRNGLSHERSPVNPQAPTPKSDQLAARLRKSELRWQEPLDGGRSLFFPHSPKDLSPNRQARSASFVEVPAADAGATDPGDIFTIPRKPLSPSRDVVVSPSVYSQDEARESLDAELASYEQGSAVIITSNCYSTGSPSRPASMQMRRASKDWRHWLKNEVEDLGSLPSDDLALSPIYTERNPGSNHHQQESAIEDDGGWETKENGRQDEETFDGLPMADALMLDADWLLNDAPKLDPMPSKMSASSRHFQSPTSNSMDRNLDAVLSRIIEDPITEAHASNVSSRYVPYRDRPSSRLYDTDCLALEERSSSRITNRFTFTDYLRPKSRLSRRTTTAVHPMYGQNSRRNVTMAIPSPLETSKENMAPTSSSSVVANPTRPQTLRRPMSSAGLPRTPTSIGAYITNYPNQNPTRSSPLPSHSSQIPRPTHSSPIRRPTTAFTQTQSSPASLPHAHLRLQAPALESDPSLANILQGPYSQTQIATPSPRPLHLRLATAVSVSRENSPFSRGAKTSPGVLGAAELEEGSLKGTPTPTGGHRLADQFLNARRWRESVRAFSPEEKGAAGEGVRFGGSSPAFL